MERYAKIVFKGRWAKAVRDGMSAVEPVAYRERFLAGATYQLGGTATDQHEQRVAGGGPEGTFAGGGPEGTCQDAHAASAGASPV